MRERLSVVAVVPSGRESNSRSNPVAGRVSLADGGRPAGVDGFAASLFGGRDSEFGRIVFTRDVDGMDPYIDVTAISGDLQSTAVT